MRPSLTKHNTMVASVRFCHRIYFPGLVLNADDWRVKDDMHVHADGIINDSVAAWARPYYHHQPFFPSAYDCSFYTSVVF